MATRLKAAGAVEIVVASIGKVEQSSESVMIDLKTGSSGV
jgi:hypothetical protein